MRPMLIAVALIAIAPIGLAACSSQEEASEQTETPAALPPGRPAIYEAARAGPEEFVRALYAVHVAGAGMGEPPAPGQDPIYDRMLNAMIGEDFRKAAGEVPTLNYDPICACQDSGPFTLDAVTIRPGAKPREAEADVVFTNMGEQKRQTLRLIKEGPMWRIADVLVPGEEPLTEQMMAAIQ
ncbi:MAG TPA: DUF3828 domain-containing protein [Brevundimonas sp.]|nr:DUF3828 domain-containing protein [Brevundimonas sp.]